MADQELSGPHGEQLVSELKVKAVGANEVGPHGEQQDPPIAPPDVEDESSEA